MTKNVKPGSPNAQHKAVRSALYRQKIATPGKGKGSYSRDREQPKAA